MIVVVLLIMVVFIMDRVEVLVCRVALIINVVMTNTEYMEDLRMIREPLAMLTPCFKKPFNKNNLSIQNSWTSNKQEKLVGAKHPP